MGLYQRRRPSPIQIWPTLVRRDDSPSSPKSSGLSSPQSSGLPSPDSPKSSGSASPTKSSFSSTSQPPPTQTAAPPPPPQVTQATTTSTTQAAASSSAAPPPPPPPPPPPSSTSQQQAQSSSAAAPTTAPASTSAQPSAPPKSSSSATGTTSSAPVALPVLSPSQGTNGTSISQSSARPSSTGSPSLPATNPTSASQIIPSSISTASRSSTTGSAFVPAQSELDGERSAIGQHRDHERPIISKGAEAAAITLSIMGFIALVVGIVFFYKHRRRRRNESSMRHAEDAFSPNNNGSLHAPETAHLDYDGPRPSLAHMTKSSTSSTELFAGAHYERPETVSTKWNGSRMAPSRIAPPQPTPNPFADPPRNKAYDQLRGRPRSTTLTDRGSWVKNPFKDPESERFDPFGELQEKARAERRKYVEDARREAEDRRRREEEQDYLEKERAGLKVPGKDGRKGSDVTVGGMGVLDRSGDGRWA